jgi:hypothetical protein
MFRASPGLFAKGGTTLLRVAFDPIPIKEK